MAKQQGLLKVRGKLGDKIFYNANGKEFVKNATVKPYELSEDTKKTAAEFAKLTKVASLINGALKHYFSTYRDSKVYYRLYKLLPKVTGANTKSPKGTRTFSSGKLAILKGFQLNVATATEKLLNLAPKFSFLPKKQLLTIDLPKLTSKSFNVPEKAVAVILEFVAFAIDFEAETYKAVQTDELVLEMKKSEHDTCSVNLALDMENKVIIVAIGVKLMLNSDSGNYISYDKRYYAGSLQELVFVKDGAIVPFIDQVKIDAPAELVVPAIKAKWVKKNNG